MRIALLYPPPWKIPQRGHAPDPRDGPPAEYQEGDLDADFFQIPYGLLSLGAQARRAGHQVKLLNLSAFPWERVEAAVAELDAELFGMSCWTANRRGTALVAELIKRHHPSAHVIVGGPHATPLAREMLAHHAAIDTIAVGESEASFAELVDRLAEGAPTQGVAGTVYRQGTEITRAEPRPAIAQLDTLAAPHEYFDTHIVMTSRGCPWACTFCGADTTWGRGFRGHSVGYVVDMLERALERLPVKMIQIKDDTFTANRKRALEICRAIRERGLDFFWSCDTRVDVLSEELLREMRLAGCERLSLGVESGSQTILRNIQKKVTVDQIIAASDLAKRFGIQVRFFMMLGNRGETRQTFEETLRFLERARPHQFIFSCLSIYPGTQDFRDAESAGWLDRETYFSGDFQELKTPFDASEEDTQLMSEWFSRNKGLRTVYRPSSTDCRAVLERLGEHHAAHLDLAEALLGEGDLDGAEASTRRALELGYPAPGLAHNTLACIAARRGDASAAAEHLARSQQLDPWHFVVLRNARALQEWTAQGGSDSPPHLASGHDFQLFERTAQPCLPGPLAEGWSSWE